MNVMTNAWLVLKSSYCQKLKKKTKTDGKLPSQGTRDLHSQRGGDGIPLREIRASTTVVVEVWPCMQSYAKTIKARLHMEQSEPDSPFG